MKKMQFLLLLFLPLFGQVFSSPLDKRDMELLDMIFRDGDDGDMSRSTREVGKSASSIACDEHSSEEDYPLFNEEESEEDCLDFLPPIEHPCFMRLILLRTPLLKHDPCANFSIATETTKKSKSRKCLRKTKTEIEVHPEQGNTTTTTTEATTATTRITEVLAKTPPVVSKSLRKVPPSKVVTTTELATTSTSDNSTTTAAPTSPIEEDFSSSTGGTTVPSTSPTTLTATTTSTTSTTRSPNQLKSLQNRPRQPARKSKKPRVPDPPKIKLDAATQPSEVIQVIFTTEAGELRRRPNETSAATTVQPETTTEMGNTLVEQTTNEVETTTQEIDVEMETTETEETSTQEPAARTEEPCDDTDEQDTNLCPQFMTAPEEGRQPTQLLSAPPPRFRKLKSYVEPILYEGHFAKPRQRIGLMTQTVPHQRDYFVTNKQIMPRPKPKYRKRLPHSIYMNNIVKGLKCVDPPSSHHHRSSGQLHPAHQYWGVKRITSRSYASPTYAHQPRFRVSGTPSPQSSQPPAPFSVPVSLYHESNEHGEDFPQDKDHAESEPSYFDTENSDLWQGYDSSHSSDVDPCQLEHDHLQRRQQKHQEIKHQPKPQHPNGKSDHASGDFGQQQMANHFFT